MVGTSILGSWNSHWWYVLRQILEFLGVLQAIPAQSADLGGILYLLVDGGSRAHDAWRRHETHVKNVGNICGTTAKHHLKRLPGAGLILQTRCTSMINTLLGKKTCFKCGKSMINAPSSIVVLKYWGFYGEYLSAAAATHAGSARSS